MAVAQMEAQDIEAGSIVAQHGPFVMTTTGVVITGEPTFDEWCAAAEWAQSVEKFSPFWIGDLLKYGEAKWGEKYTQAVLATGLSAGHLMNIASVADKIPPERRRPDLSFSHHQEVASLVPSQQEEWLTKAENDNLSVKELRHQLHVSKAQATGQTVLLGIWVKCESLDDQQTLFDQLALAGRAVKKTAKEIA